MELSQVMVVLCLAYWLLCAGSAMLWYHRCDQPILQYRPTNLMICMVVGLLIGCTMLMAREWLCDSFPCALYIVSSSVFLLLYCVPFILRLVIHIKIYGWHTMLAEAEHSMSHKSYQALQLEINLCRKFIITGALVMHSLFVAYSLWVTVSSYGTESLIFNCEFQSENSWLFSLFALYSLANVALCWNMRRYVDRFWIRWEMGLTMAVWFVVGIVFFMVNLTDQILFKSSLFDLSAWMFFGFGASILFSLLIPLMKSYLLEKNMTWTEMFRYQFTGISGGGGSGSGNAINSSSSSTSSYNDNNNNNNNSNNSYERLHNNIFDFYDLDKVTNNDLHHSHFLKLCQSYLDVPRYLFVAAVNRKLINIDCGGLRNPLLGQNRSLIDKTNLIEIYRTFLYKNGMCANLVRDRITSTRAYLNYLDVSLEPIILVIPGSRVIISSNQEEEEEEERSFVEPFGTEKKEENEPITVISDDSETENQVEYLRNVYYELKSQLERCYLNEYFNGFQASQQMDINMHHV